MTMTTNTEDYGRQQAAAQYKSIVAMVAALKECDYERLYDLRREREELVDALNTAIAEHIDDDGVDSDNDQGTEEVRDKAQAALDEWVASYQAELDNLTELAGDCADADEARQRIKEDALSVEVRSGWANTASEFEAEEFRIILCTGGPHVEIRGELSNGEPSHAYLHYKDWGTSGDYFGDGSDEFPRVERDVLLAYASVFCFGEG